MALIVAPVSLIGAAKSYARVYAMIKGKVKGSRHRYPIDLDSSKKFFYARLLKVHDKNAASVIDQNAGHRTLDTGFNKTRYIKARLYMQFIIITD